MRAPDTSLKPITVEKLLEIIKSLGERYYPPSEDTLARLPRLAVVLTARQPGYSSPGYPGYPKRTIDFLGNEVILQAPLFHPDDIPADLEDRRRSDGTFMGHPRNAKGKLWHQLVKDMYDEFCGTMAPTVPDCKFDPGAAAARFLEQVIPLVTGERPKATTIEQQLKQPARQR